MRRVVELRGVLRSEHGYKRCIDQRTVAPLLVCSLSDARRHLLALSHLIAALKTNFSNGAQR